jgi:hypothetical protein
MPSSSGFRPGRQASVSRGGGGMVPLPSSYRSVSGGLGARGLADARGSRLGRPGGDRPNRPLLSRFHPGYECITEPCTGQRSTATGPTEPRLGTT